ncbi:hypothetical protein PG993_013168 [Apiospora rasikravindrae]|uniref:UDP-N-acetylglucosamine kinase n=1 Tax=Apiospora rasikravindrae TaxID=990691 RepID=A0ABR1RYF9_9PEZI
MDDLKPFKTNPKPLPLIHLNGHPGVGKLTIARHLQTLINTHPDPALSARLVENHVLIDPCAALLDRTEPGYQSLRRALRATVFEALSTNPATHAHAYIFTESQTTDLVGATVCAEYVAAARFRGCDLVSVVLSCEDEAEHLARVGAADRVARGGKLTDARFAQGLREKKRIYRYNNFAAAGGSLEVDVSDISPEEAAKRIFRHVLDVCPELKVPAA